MFHHIKEDIDGVNEVIRLLEDIYYMGKKLFATYSSEQKVNITN